MRPSVTISEMFSDYTTISSVHRIPKPHSQAKQLEKTEAGTEARQLSKIPERKDSLIHKNIAKTAADLQVKRLVDAHARDFVEMFSDEIFEHETLKGEIRTITTPHTFMSVTSDDSITLIVGSNKGQQRFFKADRAILTEYVPFFRKILANPALKSISLPHDNAVCFDVLLTWLYDDTLPTFFPLDEHQGPNGHQVGGALLTRIYNLALKYDLVQLQDQLLDQYVDALKRDEYVLLPSCYKNIYPGLREGCKLRLLLVHMFVFSLGCRNRGRLSTQNLQQALVDTPGLAVDMIPVLRGQSTLAGGGFLEGLGDCYFHAHETAELCPWQI